MTHQRGIRPFAGEALLLDGQLYSPLLPAELRDLAAPPRCRDRRDRRAYEEKFNSTGPVAPGPPRRPRR